jgi:hypothetical protein
MFRMLRGLLRGMRMRRLLKTTGASHRCFISQEKFRIYRSRNLFLELDICLTTRNVIFQTKPACVDYRIDNNFYENLNVFHSGVEFLDILGEECFPLVQQSAQFVQVLHRQFHFLFSCTPQVDPLCH